MKNNDYHDEKYLLEILNTFHGKASKERYEIYKAILALSESDPILLYRRWDFFLALLKSDKPDTLYIAINIIPNLLKVDTENRFEKIFTKFFNLLDHESIIPAVHTAANAGKIANYKPNLRSKITKRLLQFEVSEHICKHPELVKASIISSFDEYFEESKDKEKIIQFVKGQLNSKSPKTKKAAKEFIKKWISA
jgi:hypothetical protein